MSIPLPVLVGVLVVLFVASAFFSGSETALFSLNPMQIRRIRGRHPVGAALIESLLARPTRLLSTILIGNTLINVTASGVAFVIADRLMPNHAGIVAVVGMTITVLLFGEVTPKRVSALHAETLAPGYAAILRVLVWVFSPLRVLLEAIARLFERSLHAADRTLTEDEFLSVVEAGEEEGVLKEEERTMVDSIVGLEETQASDVMTPRVDLVGIDVEDPPARHEEIIRGVMYRYLPVYRRNLDHIEGFLNVLRYRLDAAAGIEAATIPPFYVPEAASLDSLLATFQREGRHVAVVVDEYGGTAGLVTRGDILEEIVEDVPSEYGAEAADIQQIGGNHWMIDGSTSLEDVNYELDLALDAEGADRIAGWVLAHTARIPRPGDVVEDQGCRVQVQRVRRQRVTLVALEKLGPPNAEGGEPC